MSAFNARRDEDLRKLKALELSTNGQVRILSTSGNPISRISVRLKVWTAADATFPANGIGEVDAQIQLSARYPFDEPALSISSKVFNPNIYTSGRVCLGARWTPTEFLDLLVQRLFKILSFDDATVNPSSAANGDAARWYIKARAAHPEHFPSDKWVSTPTASPTIKWSEKGEAVSSVVERVVIPCPSCGAALRLPKGKSGRVDCPRCRSQVSLHM